jgi:hypothetical protein
MNTSSKDAFATPQSRTPTLMRAASILEKICSGVMLLMGMLQRNVSPTSELATAPEDEALGQEEQRMARDAEHKGEHWAQGWTWGNLTEECLSLGHHSRVHCGSERVVGSVAVGKPLQKQHAGS